MILYANAAGDRAPRDEPTNAFDAGQLFHFSQPIGGTIFGRPADVIEPPKPGIGRVIKQPMDYPKYTTQPAEKLTKPTNANSVQDRYIACMSKSKWMSAAEIAAILDIHIASVYKTMKLDYMIAITTANLRDLKIAWKLK